MMGSQVEVSAQQIARMGFEFRENPEHLIIKECPFCHSGTSDPTNQYKLYVKRSGGVYYCQRCESKGANFINQVSPPTDVKSTNDKISYAKSLWVESYPISQAEASVGQAYLRSRGLSLDSEMDSLRVHPRLRLRLEGGTPSYHPALIAKVVDSNNQMKGIHRIFLLKEGGAFSTEKLMLGPLKGGFVRIGEMSATIGVAEGIETALAVHQNTKLTMLAGLSAGGMAAINFPKSVRRVYIWADLDRSETGQRSAEKLAAKLLKGGLEVFICTPPGPLSERKSIDWLDIANSDPKLIKEALDNEKMFLGKTSTPKKINKYPRLSDDCLFGLAGDIVRKIEPHTESDPAALLLQLLTCYGNIIGRSAFKKVEADQHFLNLFLVVVGQSSKARKGTSWGHIDRIFREVDLDWSCRNVKSGLSTGEGVIHHVRDASEGDDEEDCGDFGVEDKRLLVIEPEFASVLKNVAKPGSILSTVIRNAWDKGNLQTLTKHSPEKATNAHISIVGHITVQELLKTLPETEMANGFGNRFIWVYAKRTKNLPHGGKIDTVDFSGVYSRLRNAIDFGKKTGSISLSSKAAVLWESAYAILAEEKPGLYGLITSRAEAQVLRLACMLALLDLSAIVEDAHLKAALRIWDYCEKSAAFVFGDYLGDRDADKILDELRANPNGLTKTEMREWLFHKNIKSTRLDQALDLLLCYGLVFCEQVPTNGRPKEIWRIFNPGVERFKGV